MSRALAAIVTVPLIVGCVARSSVPRAGARTVAAPAHTDVDETIESALVAIRRDCGPVQDLPPVASSDPPPSTPEPYLAVATETPLLPHVPPSAFAPKGSLLLRREGETWLVPADGSRGRRLLGVEPHLQGASFARPSLSRDGDELLVPVVRTKRIDADELRSEVWVVRARVDCTDVRLVAHDVRALSPSSTEVYAADTRVFETLDRSIRVLRRTELLAPSGGGGLVRLAKLSPGATWVASGTELLSFDLAEVSLFSMDGAKRGGFVHENELADVAFVGKSLLAVECVPVPEPAGWFGLRRYDFFGAPLPQSKASRAFMVKASEIYAAPSPDGARLALTVVRRDGGMGPERSTLQIVAMDTAKVSDLSRAFPNHYYAAWNPVWSPDGQLVAYTVSYLGLPRGSAHRERTMLADGARAATLAEGEIVEWSPRSL